MTNLGLSLHCEERLRSMAEPDEVTVHKFHYMIHTSIFLTPLAAQSTTGESRGDKFTTWKSALQGSDKKAQKDAAVALTRSALTEEGIIECVQAGVPKALVLLLMGCCHFPLRMK